MSIQPIKEISIHSHSLSLKIGFPRRNSARMLHRPNIDGGGQIVGKTQHRLWCSVLPVSVCGDLNYHRPLEISQCGLSSNSEYSLSLGGCLHGADWAFTMSTSLGLYWRPALSDVQNFYLSVVYVTPFSHLLISVLIPWKFP